jgi:4-amino-4-deoxy-L-arabinose transferase-like glycosyltransferase
VSYLFSQLAQATPDSPSATASMCSASSAPASAPPRRRWSTRSIAILVLAWLVLQIGGLFTPDLLDDVDSIYIEIAREMLNRHDYVTPYINGIRFFDKPPLMYWMAAGSMHVFGIHDWAARLPLALCVLALLLSVYALGIRLFSSISPPDHPDRGGFYAALAMATSIGPYLYTRFYIPDILLALWMTLAVHLFLIALDRIHEQSKYRGPRLRRGLIAAKGRNRDSDPPSSPNLNSPGTPFFAFFAKGGNVQSPLLPCLAFAAVMALNVLTKGLIGLVFPIGFVLLYLAITRQLRLLPRFHLLSSTAIFLVIAAPWHILAALRTPAIPLPHGLGLPATGGWAWFYLYNEHVARFLGNRIPHDYGQVPIPLFWLLTAIWIMPWATFLPGAIRRHIRNLFTNPNSPGASFFAALPRRVGTNDFPRQREAALSLILWSLLVLGFFTLSSRQEYYGLPALPALALMAAALLARADRDTHDTASELPQDRHFDRSSGFIAALRRNLLFRHRNPSAPTNPTDTVRRSALTWSLYFLVPLTTTLAAVCGYFALTAPRPAPGTDIASLLAGNPQFYNLSLGHLFDLTGAAMGLFRGPLIAVTISMIVIGPGSYLLRRTGRTYAANLTLAAAMIAILLAAHVGLARFYPILGSKGLAVAINHVRQAEPEPNDLIILDGEVTTGSTLIFYTQQQVHLINGRVNGLWYGSFWPDAPHIFETESSLRRLWAGPRRIFLFTTKAADRNRDLTPFAPVHTLAAAGGKTVLTNRP